jgi:uncharacterized lipoprotein YddW (UPF0748 family)
MLALDIVEHWSGSMAVVDRRRFLQLSAAAGAGAYVVSIGTLPAAAQGPTGADPFRPKRQFRAMWIASVTNIDWPSATGLSVEQQQAEFIAWLDLAKQLNLNAVISQVRPTADAFWPSPYEPWSQYLTGTQGKDPGYDPLAFQIAEAHRRNLEYHAWFNPYRVSMQTDPNQLVPDHPARLHPDWVFSYGPKLYYNPGIPAVRRFVEDAMLDAVLRYDIDGAHFDDYFYPYPVAGEELPDADTFATYGRGFSDIGDWRRDNINLLIREMQQRIHRDKPWVKFGVSPFGIWRNAGSDPLGSDTSGTESYNANYADTRRWVKEGWLDYINPQIYWQIGLAVADYAKLTPWWAEVADDTDVALYIGQATYKQTSGVFTDPAELSNHLTFNHGYPQVDGDVYFSAKDVRTDANGSTSLLVQTHYSRPAIIPAIRHLGGKAPQRPGPIAGSRRGGDVVLSWKSPVDHGRKQDRTTSYAIWRFDGHIHPNARQFADATNLVATVRRTDDDQQQFVDHDVVAGQRYTYVISALDRLWNESPASGPVQV